MAMPGFVLVTVLEGAMGTGATAKGGHREEWRGRIHADLGMRGRFRVAGGPHRWM
jgi:hypothetical protein